MPKFEDWFRSFQIGKTEVPAPEQSDSTSIYSIRRFTDDCNKVWEIAFTHTGRLVARAGEIKPEKIGVEWNAWVTQHNVEIPPSSNK
jgi:hypothetical protein